MNKFEANITNKRHDVADSGVGFLVSFGFFATMFIIATVVQIIGR